MWGARIVIAALIASLSGCSSSASRGAAPAPAPPAGLGIARAEAERGAGVAALAAWARDGSSDRRDASIDVRARARRGLGRVGTPEALALLGAALTADPATASDSAAALGVAAVLDRLDAGLSAGLVTAAARRDLNRPRLLEALGRGGDGAALPLLTAAVADPDPRIAAAAGIAFGRLGRRDIGLDDAARAALIPASAQTARDVRYAATYALGREHRPGASAAAAAPTGADTAAVAALRARIGDADGEIRAVAIAGLARRGPIEPALLLDRLQDPDWRVAVEAVRALAGARGSDAGRDAVAVHLVREWARLRAGVPGTSPHPLLEGLRALSAHAGRPVVRGALAQLSQTTARDPLLAGWVQCLAVAALARPAEGAAAPAPPDAYASLATCGPGLPPHLRAGLIAEAVGAGAGGDGAARWAVLASMLGDRDPRVVVAGLGALAAVWPALPDDNRDVALVALGERLGSSDSGVVGGAAEASGALLGKGDLGARRAALAAALVARAARPSDDAELATGLLTAIADGRVAEGKDVCERGRTDARPAVAAAARTCIATLAGTDPGASVAAPPAPVRAPIDPATVLGRRVTWTVETSRGPVVIALDPEVAPWHVAALVELTRRGFYDGLIFHRVVPGFVVQGGDPAGAGWGGPGFTLPSEPAGGQAAGAPGFARGAVGIADGGKDTGGSQWFVMHARAPHLEGRYTQVGSVTSGMAAIDGLIVGDKIVKASVTVE